MVIYSKKSDLGWQWNQVKGSETTRNMEAKLGETKTFREKREVDENLKTKQKRHSRFYLPW